MTATLLTSENCPTDAHEAARAASLVRDLEFERMRRGGMPVFDAARVASNARYRADEGGIMSNDRPHLFGKDLSAEVSELSTENSQMADKTPETAGGANSELAYTETRLEPRRGKGRPKDPNAKVLVSARLRPDQLAFLERFAVEGDESNVALQIETFVDMAKAFVTRPDYERDRDVGGRWASKKPASAARPTRPQMQARIKRLEERLRAAGLETE